MAGAAAREERDGWGGGGGARVDDFVGLVEGEGGVGEGRGFEGGGYEVEGVVEEVFVCHCDVWTGGYWCVWAFCVF